MRVEASALFCSYHVGVPGSSGEEAPLIVVQVSHFRLNELFASEIIAIDPRRRFELDPRGRELLARVQHLRGARFPTLAQACQTFFKAYTGDPRAKTDYMEKFVSYVVGDFDRRRFATCAREVALHGGDSVSTRFSPDLVDAVVRIDQDGSHHGPGQWIPVGHGRPYVPWDMPEHEVEREMALLREKGAFEQRAHHGREMMMQRAAVHGALGARKRWRSEASGGGAGASSGGAGAKRSKKKWHVSEGKPMFIDEEYATETYGRGAAREPHVVEGLGFDPPPGVAAKGTKWATVRSLADSSVVRVLPAHQLVTLAKYFTRRVDATEEGHLCTEPSCARCPPLFEAVRLEAARNRPPMTFAAKWKELTEVVGVPEGVAGS